MREIKFRAWVAQGYEADGNTPKDFHMVEWNNNFFADYSEVTHWGDEFPNNDPSSILMQYTGLHDKNGMEIYEGDIIQASDFYLGDSFIKASKGEVIFDNGAFCVKAHTESIGDLNSEAVSNYQVEVIGNIYENPELAQPVPSDQNP